MSDGPHIKLAEELTAELARCIKSDWVSDPKFRRVAPKVIYGFPRRFEDELLGKAPVPEFRGLLPVVVYFDSEKDRTEFVEAVAAKPGMAARKL